MLRKLTRIALIALMLYVSAVRADGTGTAAFSFSGFGTLGVVHSSEGKADYTTNIFDPNGPGYSHNWSPDTDSLIGAQAIANLTPQLSAVLQVISEQNSDKTYRPHVEWANIKYQATPDIDVRVGRIVLPIFMVSDYRKVGYANPWIRPPVEVYGLVPVSANDGLDASYRMRFGALINTVQGSYGSKHSTAADGSGVDAKEQWGIFDTTEYGNLTLQLHYHQADLDLQGPRAFFDLFRQFGAQGIAIADKYDCHGQRVAATGVGASYDPNGWFLKGEWAKSVSSCFIGSQSAWYVSGGRQFGNWTPYLTYGRTTTDSDTSAPGLDLATVPPSMVGLAAGLNAGLNGFLSSTARKTASLGTRWDFMRGVDLKVQYDHIDLDAGSHGTLINTQPGFQPGGTINVFSAAIDFVF